MSGPMSICRSNIGSRRTVTSHLQIDDIGDTNVDNAQEALIPLLELALVEDLYRNDGRVFHGSAKTVRRELNRCLGSLHVKALIPVRIQSLLDHACSMCLLSIHSDDRKRVRQAENFTLRQAIGSND